MKLNQQTKVFFFIFLFTVFSGAIRKWILSSGAVSNAVFAVQLLTPFVFIIIDYAGVKAMLEKNKLLAFYFILLVLLAAHPFNLSIIVGILGILLHSSFWFFGFYYLENKEKFQLPKIVNPIVIICGGLIVLAFIQYALPQGHILNRYADEKNVGGIIAEVGTNVRVTGTFSYITGFSAFLLFLIYFVWALIKMQYTPAISIGLLIFGLVCCWMNGSRGATYSYMLVGAFFLVFEARNTNIAKLIPRLIVPVVLIILIIQARGNLGIESNVTSAYDNFEIRRESLQQEGEERNRFLQDFYVFQEFRFKYPLTGVGLGSTYQGSAVLFGTSDYVNEYGSPESENVRVMLEGGIILLVFRFLLIFSFCKRLSISLLGKCLVAFFFFIAPTVYSIYIAIFFLMGIAYVDKAYYEDKKLKLKQYFIGA